MSKHLVDSINKEVNEYRNALIFDAKTCDWTTFESKAGMLFDYLEKIELSELKNKFNSVFKFILAVLLFGMLVLWIVNADLGPALTKLRNALLLAVLAGCGFEGFFLLNFRIAMNVLSERRHTKRQKFIQNMERDFKARIKDPDCTYAGT